MTRIKENIFEALGDELSSLQKQVETNLGFVEKLETTSDDRLGGKLTSKARVARQALRNVCLNTTHHGRMQRALRKTAIDTEAEADEKLGQAIVALIAAQVAKNELNICEKASAKIVQRKRPVPESGVAPEELAFIKAFRARNVAVSKFDQLNQRELDHIAGLIVDKVESPRHKNPNDLWGKAFSGGAIEIPVECMSDDEREVLALTTNPNSELAALAKAELEKNAGYPLNISPLFALRLCTHLSDKIYYESDFYENIFRARQKQLDDDISFVLKTLGIDEGRYARAYHVVDSQAANSFFSRDQARREALEQEANAEKDKREAEISKFIPIAKELLRQNHEAEKNRYAQYCTKYDDTIYTKDQFLGFLYDSARHWASGDGIDNYLAAASAVQYGTYQAYMTRHHPAEVLRLAEKMQRSDLERAHAVRAGHQLPAGYEIDLLEIDEHIRATNEYYCKFRPSGLTLVNAASIGEEFAEFTEVTDPNCQIEQYSVAADIVVTERIAGKADGEVLPHYSPRKPDRDAIARLIDDD